MPFFVFLWDEENLQHIAGHGVSQAEFEEVLSASWNVERSRSSGRPIAFGWTAAGRYLACVFELIDDVYCYPITAYEAEPRNET